MKIKQCLVVDDNNIDVTVLKQKLDKLSFFQLVSTVDTLESASEVLADRPIDLIFLDIKLSHQIGLTLLKSIADLPPVIITSAYPEYAAESYALGKAADYLLKPFSDERLHIALNRALHMRSQTVPYLNRDTIFLKAGRRIQRFDFQTIDYIEAFGIYSKIYSGEQVDVVNERLSSLAKKLPAQFFMRIHKSYLINIRQMSSYDRLNIWLGTTKIPIGVSYRPRLEGLLALFDANDADDSEV